MSRHKQDSAQQQSAALIQVSLLVAAVGMDEL